MKILLMTVLATAMFITTAEAKKSSSLDRIPVSDISGRLSNGSFEVKRFIARDGQIWAIGILTGVVSGKHITHGVQFPVTVTGGTPEFSSGATSKASNVSQVNQNASKANAIECALLNLAFGPVDVTVLGFHLVLAPVDIDLTAEDAPADIYAPSQIC